MLGKCRDPNWQNLFHLKRPPPLDINCTLNIEIGGDGGDNTPRGPGFRSTFELAKFLPSTVPHLLGKHHNCSRNINNDKGGDDDQHDGDEDDEGDEVTSESEDDEERRRGKRRRRRRGR